MLLMVVDTQSNRSSRAVRKHAYLEQTLYATHGLTTHLNQTTTWPCSHAAYKGLCSGSCFTYVTLKQRAAVKQRDARYVCTVLKALVSTIQSVLRDTDGVYAVTNLEIILQKIQ
jgi:hypothetical protein